MSVDDPQPNAPTIENILTDLSLASELGSWFGYGPSDQPNAIQAELYGESGGIEKTFTIHLTIKEN